MRVEKIDLKRLWKPLYNAPRDRFVLIDVPPIDYLSVEGAGDPNAATAYRAAVEALYGAAYGLKFLAKAKIGRDHVVPPLEGLWWADDMEDFVARRKDRWRWRMMIALPPWIDPPLIAQAIAAARAKRPAADPTLVEVCRLEEGRVAQTLHVGSYDDEGPVLARLHHEVLPALGLVPTGRHHEIYLGDPRKVPAERLKTLLRQPVAPSAQIS
ncbi:MAG: GyrI-like domain-containing protein [Caulobacter sp.]